jgi:hypothetical protein
MGRKSPETILKTIIYLNAGERKLLRHTCNEDKREAEKGNSSSEGRRIPAGFAKLPVPLLLWGRTGAVVQ